MIDNADVYIWGMKAGTVAWDENRQTAVFEYNPTFDREKYNLSPIMMPARLNRPFSFPSLSFETFEGLPGMLADALPDTYGKALLERWLTALGRVIANPIERLCYQGKRSMGALEFVPATEGILDATNKIEIDSLVEVASEVLDNKRKLNVNMNTDTKNALLNIIKVGTSAGGQHTKAVIAYNRKNGEVMSGQLDAPEGYEHWLIKLDGVTNGNFGEGETKQYGRIEYAYSQMAILAGINMSECMLKEENGRAHFMTKRFDRINGSEKIHMQTLCGIAHYDFRRWHTYSYEQAFMVMRQLRLTYPEQVEMFRRMVFNVIARNQDDHTKNISFIMGKDGKWKLSPAYDMSWSYNPEGRWTSQHQMSINNKWDEMKHEDVLAIAENVGIKHPEDIIGQVEDAVSKWKKIASDCGIREETSEAIASTFVYI